MPLMTQQVPNGSLPDHHYANTFMWIVDPAEALNAEGPDSKRHILEQCFLTFSEPVFLERGES